MSKELRTHLIPFVVVSVAAVTLHVLAARGVGPAWLATSWLAAYLQAGVLLFGASSIFHMARPDTPLAETMNKLDHLGIHVQIASTGIIHMEVLPAIDRAREFFGVNAVAAMQIALVILALAGMAIRAVKGDATGRIAFVVYGVMALTIPAVLDYGALFEHTSMILTLAALAVYGFSALVFFPREKLHGPWHVGVVVGWLLAGAAIIAALP